MKKILLVSLIALGVLSTSVISSEKEITFYKDLAHYKENKEVNLDEKVYITLTNTAVLDTFNVSLKKDDKLLTQKSIEIHPKSEENIFKLNKNEIVFINGIEYKLVENGKGFIKVRNKENLITYIPKSNIEVISFTNDVNADSHIAQVIPNNKHGLVDMSYSYALGELSWKPKYDLYIKNKNKVQLDYNIEINNETLSSFEDVKVKFMLETIDRVYSDYISDDNGGIFNSYQYVLMIENQNQNKNENKNEAFDAIGYNRNGYNRDGYSINIVKDSLENGKRFFEFSNLVNIPAKSKTTYPFKNALEMSYEKTNKIYINSDLKENNVLIPESFLAINNSEKIKLSKGVLRIFSGDKGYDSTVIKEHELDGNKGREDVKFSIGDNYGLTLKVIKNEKHINKNLFVTTSILNKKDIKNYDISKITFEIENESNEDNLLILSTNNLLSEKNINKIQSLFKNENVSEKEYLDIEKRIDDLSEDFIKIDLSKKEHVVYLLKKKKGY